MTRPPLAARAVRADDLAGHLGELRAALEQQRRFRIEQLTELRGSAAGYGPDTEPWSEITASLTSAATAALADIDAALQRLVDGRYGRCVQCRSAIPLDRLEILPMVSLCMRCQQAAESLRV